MTVEPALAALPGWDIAVTALVALNDQRGADARERGNALPRLYEGRRAVMVVDAVASAQRHYETRVQRIVTLFQATPGAASLAALAEHGPGNGLGLRGGEPETMRQVAAGLARFGTERGLDDDAATLRWSQETAPFALAHRLDPYVGAVKGIGPTLFAYLRLLSGADTLKPDSRVWSALQRLGLAVPNEPNAMLVVCRGLSDATGIPLPVLDQLLWWSEGTDRDG